MIDGVWKVFEGKLTFIDEAKLSANLIHGNVVQIFQLGEIEGEYFMAMEFIEGSTLRLSLDFDADFADIFEVRGARRQRVRRAPE